MAFRVGDRVKCVSPRDELVLNQIYTIESITEDGLLGTSYYWVGQSPLLYGGYDGHRFELVEAAPPPVVDNRQTIVLYTVIYKYAGEMRSRGYTTENEITDFLVMNPRAEVVGKKKITVRI